MIEVLSPLSGTAMAMADVPDPVFAAGTVGQGIAISPDVDADSITVTSPIAGKLIRVMPHAFIVASAEGPAVLVHIGIDTVTMQDKPFQVLKKQKESVAAGEPVIAFSPVKVVEAGLSPVCPIVAMQADTIDQLVDAGADVEAGTPVLSLS